MVRYVLFVATDALDALDGGAIAQSAPHSEAVRVVCAEPDASGPYKIDAIAASTPAEAWESLEALPRPSLAITVGNTPLAAWASMWAAHRGVPTMHHHAGIRSPGGIDRASDKIGTALDATADLLSLIARRDHGNVARFSPSFRIVGWPSIEAWVRLLPSAMKVEPGESGCLALLGHISPNEYGWIAKLFGCCRHVCRRFEVYASRDFRETIVKVGVPLPEGFSLRIFSDLSELADGVAKCRMLVTNDERLQALSAAAGTHTVLVGAPPSIRWLIDQGDYVRHLSILDSAAAAKMLAYWESLPNRNFHTDAVPDASSAVAEWVRSDF